MSQPGAVFVHQLPVGRSYPFHKKGYSPPTVDYITPMNIAFSAQGLSPGISLANKKERSQESLGNRSEHVLTYNTHEASTHNAASKATTLRADKIPHFQQSDQFPPSNVQLFLSLATRAAAEKIINARRRLIATDKVK